MRNGTRRAFHVAATAACVLVASASHAEERGKQPPSAIAPAAAIIPGVVVHGSGHFVSAERRTAWTLLAVEGLGVTLAGGSLTAIALTGASRRTIAPLAALTVTGVSLIAFSFLSDVYGVTTRGDGLGSPLRSLPRIETRAGGRFVHDPQFRYGMLTEQAIDARVSTFRARVDAWQAPAARASRAALLLSRRWSPPPDAADGSFVDLEGVVSHRSYARDSFSAATYELAVSGRLDLHHVARTLRGAYTELRLGAALIAYRYGGAGTGSDELLLLRSAFGVYLGRRSEIALFYDHRRDTLAGGGLLPGIPAGYLGFGGVEGRAFLDDTWGVAFDAQVGGAYVAAVSLVFRQGAVAW